MTLTFARNNMWHFHERAAMLKIHCLAHHFAFVNIHKGKFVTQALKDIVSQGMGRVGERERKFLNWPSISTLRIIKDTVNLFNSSSDIKVTHTHTQDI